MVVSWNKLKFPDSRLWTFRGETHSLLLYYSLRGFPCCLSLLWYRGSDTIPVTRDLCIYEVITWPLHSQDVVTKSTSFWSWLARGNSCATLRYVTLRYVDEVMDLLSILTRMLAGQSLEISPNKWHSLCTPPVFRNTTPNDLRNNQKNYQMQQMISFQNLQNPGYPSPLPHPSIDCPTPLF